jgi:hypothetical protein
MSKIPEYWVIKDTREKNGYDFTPFLLCKGTKVSKLDTGDYTIDGLQDRLTIERKASPSEFANNLGKEYKRFYNELGRMSKFEAKFLILEFTFDDLIQFPKNSQIPPSLESGVRITGKFMHKRVVEIQLDFNIQVVFAGDKFGGFFYTQRIMKNMNEKYRDLIRCETL